MPITVDFTVTITGGPKLPKREVHVALDVDSDFTPTEAEFIRAESNDASTFTCSITAPNLAATTGTHWWAVVRAATGSTYTVTATSGGKEVQAAQSSTVEPGTAAVMHGILA